LKKKGIKSWAKEDRPREKMMALGRENLTDAELLAILIGTGSFNTSAVDLAKEILKSSNNNLHELGKKGIEDFKGFHGIGEAKAITILAALELGRRRQTSKVEEKPKITCSRDAYEFLSPVLQDLKHEAFYILLLSQNNTVKKRIKISTGGVAGTLVDNKIIFKEALSELCTAIILGHNHPSGSIIPSQADIQLTAKIKEAAALFEIRVLDHIIVGDGKYYSFADEGNVL